MSALAGHEASLRIAGVDVHVRCRDAGSAERVRRWFGGRRETWSDAVVERSIAETSLRGSMLHVRRGALEAHADLGSARVVAPPNPSLINFLVLAVVSARLSERAGLLLHAAAIERGGGVLVAFGQSGAGKSTLARELGGRVLADEFVALVRGRRGWRARSTPWWRGGGPPAPLGRLVWLVRGEPPSVREVRGGELCAALWREVGRYVPGADADRRVFDLCADLARLGAVRVAAPEGGVVDAVRAAA